MRVFAILVMAISLQGCANYGPTTKSYWPQMVSPALPEGDKTIEFALRVMWIPNQYGATLGLTGGQMRTGILVLTPRHLSFLEWAGNPKTYHALWSRPLSEIASVDGESVMLARYIIVSTKDVETNSFLGDDADEVPPALQLLRKRVALLQPSGAERSGD